MDIILLVARLVLAVVFGVAGVAKLVDQTESRQALLDFGVPVMLATPLGILLPLTEIAIAITLIPTAVAWWGALGALILLGVFCAAISLNLSQGRAPACRCFGQLYSEPIGGATLARNGVLTLVAVLILWQGWNDAGLSALTWLGEMSTGERIWIAMNVMGLVVLAAQSWFVLHLLQQNGRSLTRVERLEEMRIPGARQPQAMTASIAAGLPIGFSAPRFLLPGLTGKNVTLDELRTAGKPVVLIFSDPNCVPCNCLMPDITHWQRAYARQMTLAVISRGTLEANRTKTAKHKIGNILLQKDQEVAEAYNSHGTPSAVVVTSEGIIGSLLVSGVDPIRDLVARLTGVATPRMATEIPPQFPPNGHLRSDAAMGLASPIPLKVGDPAPLIKLPDLAGNPVNLEEHWGSPTLVLFFDPACGFCQQMLPALKAWEPKPSRGTPKLMIISTGTVAINQALGLRSSVMLDQQLHAAHAFGAYGTPMAVLIDGDGRIASELAAGATAILALAGREQSRTLTG